MSTSDVVVVGAGIFGQAAALELQERGRSVTVLDAGEIPNPLAASTDISKVVRIEYGVDETYMSLGEEARNGWLAWNEKWELDGEEPLYHETGVLMCSMDGMAPGGFEFESWNTLRKRGHEPERLDARSLQGRFPAWRTGMFVDGFYHQKGGYVESGRVVERLAGSFEKAGGRLVPGVQVVQLEQNAGSIDGVQAENGDRFLAAEVVVAAGAWTAVVCPELAGSIRSTGHPVFHLRPRDPALYRSDVFPTFTADVARTGFYGFPLNRDGVVKIGVHAVGREIHPDHRREVSESQIVAMRRFVGRSFPDLADADLVYTRLCLYSDTQDEDFWIARDPVRRGLTVASGGSGHGFKFGPVLGSLIADVVEEQSTAKHHRFRWRPDLRLSEGREAARCHSVVA